MDIQRERERVRERKKSFMLCLIVPLPEYLSTGAVVMGEKITCLPHPHIFYEMKMKKAKKK
jgi:hypothetical protein